jgi:hypothetical protein
MALRLSTLRNQGFKDKTVGRISEASSAVIAIKCMTGCGVSCVADGGWRYAYPPYAIKDLRIKP